MTPADTNATVESLIREAHRCTDRAAKLDPRDANVYTLIDTSEKLLAAAEALKPGSTSAGAEVTTGG